MMKKTALVSALCAATLVATPALAETVLRIDEVSGLGLTTDDVVHVVTSSGAGYGDPKKRDPDAVRMDIKNGLITPERARKIHGV